MPYRILLPIFAGLPLDTGQLRADNAPMKSRREQIASMSQAERDRLIPLARKVRADARRDALQVVPGMDGYSLAAAYYRDAVQNFRDKCAFTEGC